MQENPNIQIGEREKCDNLFPMQKNVSFIPFVHNTFICDVIVLINVYNYSFVNISCKVLKILICFQCSVL